MSDMKESKQIELFTDELDKLTDRYASEFDLTVASMVGVFQVKIHELIYSAMATDDEEEEEDDEEETFS
jgi:hypothetical protein